MGKRWAWFARQSNKNEDFFSVLACVETIASVSAFLFLIATYDWAVGILISAYITPIFFLRSPESLKSTKEYFERAVNRPHRFQLYGAMVAVWMFTLNAPLWIWLLVLPPAGLAIGHLYNSWYVQFSRSLYYFKEGLRALPKNYYETLFVVDITVQPEMFPESKTVQAIPHWQASIFFFPHPRTPLTFLLSVIITLTLVAVVVLRFASKASALIYLPLIYLSWPSKLHNNKLEQQIWIKSQSAKSIELLRFFLSVSVIVFFLLSIFDASEFLNTQDVTAAENPIRFFATLYYITDISDIKPWQTLSLLAAILSIWLYFLMDGCRKEALAGREKFNWRISVIVSGQRIRTLLSISWLLISAYFTLEFYHVKCDIGETMARILSYVWGEAICSAP